MWPYFQKLPTFGLELNEGQIKSAEENVKQIKEVEAAVKAAVQKVRPPVFRKRISMPVAR